jgi:hypothetical protein
VAATSRPAGAPRPSLRDHQPGRIRHDRVRQFDLHSDDRPQPGLLRRRRKADYTIEAVVVRDGQPGKPQFHGTLDQLIRRRRPVEE